MSRGVASRRASDTTTGRCPAYRARLPRPGASQLIHQALIDLRDRGVALLIVSEDLDELFVICDRIAVLTRGQLSPLYRAAELTSERVGSLMSGGAAPDERSGHSSAAVPNERDAAPIRVANEELPHRA